MTPRPFSRLVLAGLTLASLVATGACALNAPSGGPVGPTAVITEIFGPIAPQALAIARCESTLNPRAVSPTNDFGLFQINGVHQGEFTAVTGQPWSQVFDAYWNTTYAKHLYDVQGWRPWSCAGRVGL